MKVLIVEDFDDTRELIKTMMLMRGCRVAEATDGVEAVKAATRERPDLILMDLNLPVLDGWEATRRITALEETKHIPVVAISAQCRDGWREKALAAGARDCMQKPLDFATFDDLLERFPPIHGNGYGCPAACGGEE